MPCGCDWGPLYACVHLAAREKGREEEMGDGEGVGVCENTGVGRGEGRGNESWGGGVRGWGRQ